MGAKNKRQLKSWDITAERFVGFIDIMGFKDLVARNNHETIYGMMKKVSDAVQASQSVYGVDYENDDLAINIIMMTYSDSIMVYSRDLEESSLQNFLGAIGTLTEDLFQDEIPHKGAIAKGTMTLDFDKSIFFGQPLIDAYLLQEELNFYGIVAHASMQNVPNFINDIAVIEYPCPFKNGNAKHFTALPAVFFNDPYEEEPFLKLLNSISNLRAKTSGYLRKYIDNTITYLSSENSRRAAVTKAENEMRETNSKTLETNPSSKDDLPF